MAFVIASPCIDVCPVDRMHLGEVRSFAARKFDRKPPFTLVNSMSVMNSYRVILDHIVEGRTAAYDLIVEAPSEAEALSIVQAHVASHYGEALVAHRADGETVFLDGLVRIRPRSIEALTGPAQVEFEDAIAFEDLGAAG